MPIGALTPAAGLLAVAVGLAAAGLAAAGLLAAVELLAAAVVRQPKHQCRTVPIR